MLLTQDHVWTMVETLAAGQYQFLYRYFMVGSDSSGFFGEGSAPTADTGRTNRLIYGTADPGSQNNVTIIILQPGRFVFSFNDSSLDYSVARIAPLAPENIQAWAQGRSGVLSWTQVTDLTYTVYRDVTSLIDPATLDGKRRDF